MLDDTKKNEGANAPSLRFLNLMFTKACNRLRIAKQGR